MRFSRLQSGRRRARRINWLLKLMLIAIIVVVAVSQLWQVFGHRKSAAPIAGSAASPSAPR